MLVVTFGLFYVWSSSSCHGAMWDVRTLPDYSVGHTDISGQRVAYMVYDGDYEIQTYNMQSGTATRITQNTSGDRYPRISGDRVAWESGDFSISLYDHTHGTNTLVDFGSTYNWNTWPTISGNHVAWTKQLGHNFSYNEVYLYDGATKRRLTFNNYQDGSVSIDGNFLVWCGEGAGIYLHDISTNLTAKIADVSGSVASTPMIRGNNVVWADYDGEDTEIFRFDIAAMTLEQLTDNEYYDNSPVASLTQVAWYGSDGNDAEIFRYDIGNDTTVQITNNALDDRDPKVSDELLVWQAGVLGGSGGDIFAFDGAQTTRLSLSNSYGNEFPVVDGLNVAWQGWTSSGPRTFAAVFVPEPDASLLAALAALLLSPLLAVGRRRRMRAPALLATIIVAFTSLSSSVFAITYHITDLGDLAGGADRSFASAVNNAGQVVGYSSTALGDRGFLWTNNGLGMLDLGLLPGESYSTAVDINDLGQVTGSSGHSGSMSGARAYVWTSSSGMMDIGDFASGIGFVIPAGINNSGQVAGTSYDTGALLRAFRWQDGAGMENLGALGGSEAGSFGINNLGHVVGQARTPDWPHVHGFIWKAGEGMIDLGVLPDGEFSYALAINDLDQVVGYGPTAPGFDFSTLHAFLWESGTGIVDLGTLAGMTSSEAHAINNHGIVVGTSGGSLSQRAFIYRQGGILEDLNQFLDESGLGWTLLDARDINDANQIVGFGYTPTGATHGYLLTPIPEPTTQALTFAAVGLLASVSRRRRRETLKGIAPSSLAGANKETVCRE